MPSKLKKILATAVFVGIFSFLSYNIDLDKDISKEKFYSAGGAVALLAGLLCTYKKLNENDKDHKLF